MLSDTLRVSEQLPPSRLRFWFRISVRNRVGGQFSSEEIVLEPTLTLDFFYLKIINILYPRYHSKIIAHILKNKWKKKCVCINEIIQIIQLIKMKIKMKMKNSSHRYDANRPRSRHEPKYNEYKKCLTVMMFLCIKQHLSNIWSSVHKNVKQHWG